MPAGEVAAGTGPGGRLRALGLELPSAPHPLGSYVEVSQAGPLLMVSGTLPIAQGQLAFTGRLGEDLSVEQGREAARLAALNALAAVQEYVGDLDRVRKLAKLTVYLATTVSFMDYASVADGASDLFAQLFGCEQGHARMVAGVVSLPKGAPVVVETIFEISKHN